MAHFSSLILPERRMSNGLFEVIFGLRFSSCWELYRDLLTHFIVGHLRGVSSQQLATENAFKLQ